MNDCDECTVKAKLCRDLNSADSSLELFEEQLSSARARLERVRYWERSERMLRGDTRALMALRAILMEGE